MKIENAFGILKNRFQILNNLNADLKYAVIVVTICCILHNFLIEEGNSNGSEIMELNASLTIAKKKGNPRWLQKSKGRYYCRCG